MDRAVIVGDRAGRDRERGGERERERERDRERERKEIERVRERDATHFSEQDNSRVTSNSSPAHPQLHTCQRQLQQMFKTSFLLTLLFCTKMIGKRLR